MWLSPGYNPQKMFRDQWRMKGYFRECHYSKVPWPTWPDLPDLRSRRPKNLRSRWPRNLRSRRPRNLAVMTFSEVSFHSSLISKHFFFRGGTYSKLNHKYYDCMISHPSAQLMESVNGILAWHLITGYLLLEKSLTWLLLEAVIK